MPTPDDPSVSTSASDQARRRAELASLLHEGIAAARHGRREHARRLLEAALTIDPANEDGWLWLAALTDNRSLARAMVRRVLDDHPESTRARDALRWLDRAEREGPRPAAAPEEATAGTGDAVPALVPPWERAGDAEETGGDVATGRRPAATEPLSPSAPGDATAEGARQIEEGAAPSPVGLEAEPGGRRPQSALPWLAAAWRRLRLRLGAMPRRELVRQGIMVALIGFLVIGSLFLLSLLSSPSRATSVRVALGVITETPTITPSPTPTLTPSMTPTPTHTPTLTPSPTPSPTITPTPSPTPTPAWLTPKILPLPLDEKWIEVDLTTQTLYAYEGETRVFTATVSTGKGNTPTVQGKFRIQRKFESQAMSGPGYYLPNVPYIMYFYANFALHGAYWHDKWGTPTSHGCVNLKREDAKWLYDWTDPPVPEGAKSAIAGAANQGTWVIVHK